MGKYIDRIIEVLDDNNVWKAVVLPRNEMGEKEESIVFGYLSDRNYDMVLDGTLVCHQRLCFSTEASRVCLLCIADSHETTGGVVY